MLFIPRPVKRLIILFFRLEYNSSIILASAYYISLRTKKRWRRIGQVENFERRTFEKRVCMVYNYYLFSSMSETKRKETKVSCAASRNAVRRSDRSGTTYSWKALIHRGRAVQQPSIVNTIERDLTTGRDGRFATLKLLQRVANSGPVAHETTLTLKPAYCYRLGKT